MRIFYGIAFASWVAIGLIGSYQRVLSYAACKLVGNSTLYCLTWTDK